MNRSDELMHYGVVGMKWGQRKARKNYKLADKYDRKASHTRNTKKALKLDAKANQHRRAAELTENYHKKMAGEAAYNYTKNQSTGRTLAKAYTMGGYGALKYNQARAKGEDRGRAGAKMMAYGTANNLTGGALSVAQPRISRANAERKQKKRVR